MFFWPWLIIGRSFFGPRGKGALPILNKYTGRIRPKTCTFFHSSDGVAISLVEVYEVVENMSFRSVKRLKIRTNGCIFWLRKKSRKCSGFVIYSYFKDSTFISVKGDVKF